MARCLAFALAALAIAGCKKHTVVAADAGIVDAASVEAAVAAVDASRHYGSDYPLATFAQGSNVTISGNPPTCVGGCIIAASGFAACPINLASCVTGTLGTANGGFACSSLSSCTGGQLPTSGIGDGTHNSLLATDNTGNVAWKTITPGGDITLSTPITGSSIPFEVIGWNTIPLSGSAPAIGNVYVFDGSIWRPGTPTGAFAFSATTSNHVIPSSGVFSLGNMGVTVPTGGGNISVSITFLISNPDTASVSGSTAHIGDDIVVGVGFNSSTSFDEAVEVSAICRDSTGSANTGWTTVVAPDFFANQARGNYTIYALTQSASGVNFTVTAQLAGLVTK